jgi:hypothetical protein
VLVVRVQEVIEEVPQYFEVEEAQPLDQPLEQPFDQTFDQPLVQPFDPPLERPSWVEAPGDNTFAVDTASVGTWAAWFA